MPIPSGGTETPGPGKWLACCVVTLLGFVGGWFSYAYGEAHHWSIVQAWTAAGGGALGAALSATVIAIMAWRLIAEDLTWLLLIVGIASAAGWGITVAFSDKGHTIPSEEPTTPRLLAFQWTDQRVERNGTCPNPDLNTIVAQSSNKTHSTREDKLIHDLLALLNTNCLDAKQSREVLDRAGQVIGRSKKTTGATNVKPKM